MQKVAIWAPSHDFVWLCLRNQGMYRQSEKKLVKQQYLLQTSLQYGELRLTNGWDWLAGLEHPVIFQRLLRLGSVTARHSSNGRQPNFAALNRGRHLCSAGRPSRWALAHILVVPVLSLHSMSITLTRSSAIAEWLRDAIRNNCCIEMTRNGFWHTSRSTAEFYDFVPFQYYSQGAIHFRLFPFSYCVEDWRTLGLDIDINILVNCALLLFLPFLPRDAMLARY